MGKTTVVIDEELMRAAMEATGLRTKRRVIEEGLHELVRRRNRELLRRDLGTFDLDLTIEALGKNREAD
jgi:Arc/MetJ family transcription regulator